MYFFLYLTTVTDLSGGNKISFFIFLLRLQLEVLPKLLTGSFPSSDT